MSKVDTAFHYHILCHPGTTTIEIVQTIEKFARQHPQAKIIEMNITVETSRSDGFAENYGPNYESAVRFRLAVG